MAVKKNSQKPKESLEVENMTASIKNVTKWKKEKNKMAKDEFDEISQSKMMMKTWKEN